MSVITLIVIILRTSRSSTHVVYGPTRTTVSDFTSSRQNSMKSSGVISSAGLMTEVAKRLNGSWRHST